MNYNNCMGESRYRLRSKPYEKESDYTPEGTVNAYYAGFHFRIQGNQGKIIFLARMVLATHYALGNVYEVTRRYGFL